MLGASHCLPDAPLVPFNAISLAERFAKFNTWTSKASAIWNIRRYCRASTKEATTLSLTPKHIKAAFPTPFLSPLDEYAAMFNFHKRKVLWLSAPTKVARLIYDQASL